MKSKQAKVKIFRTMTRRLDNQDCTNESASCSERPSFCDYFLRWVESKDKDRSKRPSIDLSNLLVSVQLLQDQHRFLTEISRILESVDNHNELLVEFIELLQPNFCHPWSSVRRLLLSMLKLFDPYLNFTYDDDSKTIFSILLEAEEMSANMDTYRQKVSILRKIKYGSHARFLPSGVSADLLENVILRIYLAQLFDNFTLLWPMVIELVESYSYGLPIDQFWSVFASVLSSVTVKIHSFEVLDRESIELMSGFETEKQINPDYFSFRLQLFKLLSNFADIAERRTKILSSVLIDLYRNEFQPLDDSSKHVVNLTVNENTDETSKQSDLHESVGEPWLKRYGRKRITKALIYLLNVFAQFSSAKSVYREPEIREIYEELLLSNDPELQKSALECIFSYKFKFLTPYKENFERIIDEKTFRDELVRFTVDEQNNMIAEEHRSDLIPFLMRLLFGKLQAHVATRGQTKRAAIFRYLASCRSAELDIFFDILFGNLSNVFDISKLTRLRTFCENIVNGYNPKQTIPLRKIQSCLNNIVDIVKKLTPSLSDEQCSIIFKICMVCSLFIRLGFDHANSLKVHNVKALKDLRLQVCSSLSQIFEAYQQRAFLHEELLCLWSLFVEPTITIYNVTLKQAGENHYILPVSLTRLFISWTRIPLLFHLLNAKFIPVIKGDSPIELVCNTLIHNGTPKSVQNSILEGILNLLTLADESSNDRELKLPQVALPEGFNDINFGTLILLSQTRKILLYLSDRIPKDAKSAKSLPDLYLNILSRLSEFVSDRDVAIDFASTLILYVSKCNFKSDQKLSTVLTTISRFVVFVPDPEEYLRKLVRLFGSLKSRAPREALVSIIVSISKIDKIAKNSQLCEYLNFLVELESWDAQRINEPDLIRRHTAFSSLLESLVNNLSIPALVLQLLAHSAFHSLLEVEDLSLRSSAANFFRRLAEYIAKSTHLDDNDRRGLLHSHLIDLCLKGLQAQSEIVRHEFIHSLANLIDLFPTDEILEPLKVLRSLNDKDLDFFENSTHIQLHRRQRSFYKLAEQLATKEVEIGSNTLHKFIIPILIPYLTDVTSKTSALSDQSIRLFGEILKLTPWPKYYRFIEEYINKLKNHDNKDRVKIYVRVLVAVIDAFHFDLRACVFPNWLAESNPKIKSDQTTVDLELSDDQKILQTWIKVILPQLRECIRPMLHSAHRKAQSDEKHFEEDDEIERAPIALATSKLLQKLPQWVLDQHLNGVLLTLFKLILSRSYNIRQEARKIMASVVRALGSNYLPFVIKEMRQLMHKGYQVHIMIFTVQQLVKSMEDLLTSGDLDTCLEDIIEVCKQELFTDLAEEREVGAIKENVPEAKSNKTFDTYVYLGRFLSPSCLALVIEPMREIVDTKPNAKTMKQLGELLRAYSIGLKQNKAVDPKTMLLFVHHNLSRSVTDMLTQQSVADAAQKEEERKRSNGYRPESCLLLAKEPKRLGVIVKTSVKSRASIFVEFALQVLAGLLKSQSFDSDNLEDVSRLDPLMPLLSDCLKLKYDKIVSTSLRCLTNLLKFPLPEIRMSFKNLVDRLFVILHDYAGLGTAGNKATILELNQLLFKCFSLVIRDAPLTVLTSKRIQLLLNYCETDLLDSHKQATAFLLIKSIVGRKIEDPKVESIIDYLSELSITSEIPHVRTQCRQIILLFLSVHPKRDFDKLITFFLAQLEYEFEDGRLSALEILHSIFETSSEEILDKFALVSLIKLAARFINDESSICHNFIAMSINKLISSVSDKLRIEIFTVVKDWMGAGKEPQRYLSLKILNEFIKSKTISEKNLIDILSLVVEPFNSTAFEKFSEEIILVSFEFLNLLMTNSTELSERLMNKKASLDQFLTCNDASSIQMASSELVHNSLLNSKTLQALSSSLGLLRICETMCIQLRKSELPENMTELAIKNLVGIVPNLSEDDVFSAICKKIGLVCKHEIIKFPTEATRRLSIFKFIGACILKVDDRKLRILLDTFMPYLHREMNRKSTKHTDILQQMSIEVGELFKNRLGEITYAQKLAECQKEAASKYESRKRKEKERAVIDPAGAALKKQRKQAMKIEARKRKIDELKPYRIAKRKRQIEARMKDEE